jgi:hypothetical protein
MAEDGFQAQARALTDQNFERQRRDLERLHAQETRDQERAWQRQSRSFAENKEKALADHRAQITAIDGREAQAMQALLNRQRSLAGRVVGLVRGRKHHLGQQEALRASFETQRVGKHRQLEQLQGRQDAARLRASDRHAKDLKDMQQRQGQARHELAEWQSATREATERSQARALAERSLRQAFERGQEQEREQGLKADWEKALKR